MAWRRCWTGCGMPSPHRRSGPCSRSSATLAPRRALSCCDWKLRAARCRMLLPAVLSGGDHASPFGLRFRMLAAARHMRSRSYWCFLVLLPQVLGVLAHAKVADHLASGPKTAAELAPLTGAHIVPRSVQGRPLREPATTCCLPSCQGDRPAAQCPCYWQSGLHAEFGLKNAAGLDVAKLFRVLRLAVAQGLLAGATDQSGVPRFRNNGISATLLEDHPNCTR